MWPFLHWTRGETLVPSEHNLVEPVSWKGSIYVIFQSDLSNKNECQIPETLFETSVCWVLMTACHHPTSIRLTRLSAYDSILEFICKNGIWCLFGYGYRSYYFKNQWNGHCHAQSHFLCLKTSTDNNSKLMSTLFWELKPFIL